MAKDPAFLWYPGDWLGGTLAFSRAHKGAYMDLLMYQFNEGHMALEDIQIILGSDFELMWESKLKAKFVQDENGFYYNQKLEFEIVKRRKYTQSRKNNLSHKDTHIKPHMVRHMENENENTNEIINTKQQATNTEVSTGKHWDREKEYFLANEQWIYKFCTSKRVSKVELETAMKEFVNDIDLRNDFKDQKELTNHFVNWWNKRAKNGSNSSTDKVREAVAKSYKYSSNDTK